MLRVITSNHLKEHSELHFIHKNVYGTDHLYSVRILLIIFLLVIMQTLFHFLLAAGLDIYKIEIW